MRKDLRIQAVEVDVEVHRVVAGQPHRHRRGHALRRVRSDHRNAVRVDIVPLRLVESAGTDQRHPVPLDRRVMVVEGRTPFAQAEPQRHPVSVPGRRTARGVEVGVGVDPDQLHRPAERLGLDRDQRLA